MATESMAAIGAREDQPAHQRRRVHGAGRGGDGHRQEGAQEEADADGRLPALAVEGDAHDRHEEQDPEPAAHAVGGHHEEAHRRHVEGRSDDEGLRGHAAADQQHDEDAEGAAAC